MLFSALTVECTLNFNHMSNVLGEHGLSGPGQQLPLLIGLFSFLRICWILIKASWLGQGEDAETEGTRPGFEKGSNVARTGNDGSRKGDATTGTSSPSNPPVIPIQQHGHLNSIPLLAAHADRPWVHRVLVAYLPWLADFGFFRKRQEHGFEAVRRGSEGLEMQRTAAAYNNERKGVDVNMDVESLRSRNVGPSRETEI
jgi:hypothetical protein